MQISVMATKTISIDLEAYERLRAARRVETESFSQVIKRALWTTEPKTAGRFLEAMRTRSPMSEVDLDLLEKAQREDLPPDDPWEGNYPE